MKQKSNTPTSVRIPEEIKKKAVKAAKLNGRSLSNFIIHLLTVNCK